MNPVKKAIKKYWGKRCGDHHPDCPCCQAWAAYDQLVMDGLVTRCRRKAVAELAKRGE